MADFDREAARARREEVLACHPIRGMGEPYPVYCGACTTPENVVWYPCPEIGKITMADADALDAALDVAAQRVETLERENKWLRAAAQRVIGTFAGKAEMAALRAALVVDPEPEEDGQ